MKRTISIFGFCMVAALTACGGGSSKTQSEGIGGKADAIADTPASGEGPVDDFSDLDAFNLKILGKFKHALGTR